MPKRKAATQEVPANEEGEDATTPNSTPFPNDDEEQEQELEQETVSASLPSPPLSGRITRSFVKQISGQQNKQEQKKEDTQEAPTQNRTKRRKKRKGYSQRPRTRTVYLPHTVTALPVNQLPELFERVMKALPPSKSNYYEIYEIQNLIVTCALDDTQFSGKGAAEALFKHVYDVVTTDEKYCKHQQEGTGSISVIRDAEVLRRYDEFMEAPEQQKQRSYRNDSKVRHIWTEKEVLRFKEAFSKYGNGPTSNRKIAEYIGNGVHPNHVAFFKQQYKKQLREASKKEAQAAETKSVPEQKASAE